MAKIKLESIELMKFFAALLITNSHFDILYGKCSFLGTGGAIGNALFFFCSGYTLMLSGSVNFRFDQFYKRRINRIYPSVLTWTLLGSLLFSTYQEYHAWGGWFVPCIMLYYVALYLFNKYLTHRVYIWFLFPLICGLVWYFLTLKNADFYIFNVKLSWIFYSFSFLMGSFTTLLYKKSFKMKTFFSYIGLMASVILFFLVNYAIKKYHLLDLQWVVFIPLSLSPYFAFNVLSSKFFVKLYYIKKIGPFIKIVSGLCLEIFLVQLPFITDRFNYLFPFNILLVLATIVIVAYCVRTIGRFAVQTFNKEREYNYKAIFKLY